MVRQLIAAAVVLLAGTVALGQGGPSGVRAEPAAQAQAPLAQLSGDPFDQAFLTQMIEHHAAAVRMARPAAANAPHGETKALAAAIVADQTREIDRMRAWLNAWYNADVPDPLPAGGPAPMAQMPAGQSADHAGHQMPAAGQNTSAAESMPMAGPGGAMAPTPMGGMDMSADLWTLPGNRLEVVFLSLMIPHHQGAIDMARLAADRAAHAEVKNLASSIASSQSAEIEQMNSWLAAWYGL